MKRTPLNRKTRLKATTIRASARRPVRSKAIRARMDAVASIGCIACLIAGHPGTPAELHHPRAGTGGGQKAPDSDVIPLCPAHHRGTLHPKVPSIHRDKTKFIAEFGTERELLARVNSILEESK